MLTIINKADRLSSSDDRHIAKLDGKKTKTIKKLYKKLGSRLEFPDYFGNNLDAFADMLCDLSWLKAPNVILYIKNMDDFLSEENKEKKQIITEIFIEAVTGQIEEERTFEVIKVV